MPYFAGLRPLYGVTILENEVMKVSIPLAKLMEDISRSVQNSNFLLEQVVENLHRQNL